MINKFYRWILWPLNSHLWLLVQILKADWIWIGYCHIGISMSVSILIKWIWIQIQVLNGFLNLFHICYGQFCIQISIKYQSFTRKIDVDVNQKLLWMQIRFLGKSLIRTTSRKSYNHKRWEQRRSWNLIIWLQFHQTYLWKQESNYKILTNRCFRRRWITTTMSAEFR